TKSVVIEAEESIEAVALYVTASESFRDLQLPLFERKSDDGSSGELNLLLDRLGTRLGAGAGRRVRVADDRLPERGHQAVDLAEYASSGMHTSPFKPRLEAHDPISIGEKNNAPRPLRLFPQPVAAQIDWPRSFVCDGRRQAIRAVRGPERIESGWWRERD